MMKKLFMFVLVLLFVLSILSIACCTFAEAAAPVKIGVLVPKMTHGWVSGITYYAQEYCKELEEAGKAETKLAISTNAETMTTQIEEMIQWGAQAFVIAPQWVGMEGPVQDAIDRGIVVVAFDIDIPAEGIYKVTGDNKSIGVVNAQFIVDTIGDHGTVVVLVVPTSGSVNELRLAGFYETVTEKAPELVTIEYATASNREDGLKTMADALTANPHIDAVFSQDDETSLGVMQAIAEAGRTDIKVITGGGGCQAYFKVIKESTDISACSALYSPAMIKDCFDVALAVLSGEECEPLIVIPTTVVDASNVDQYIDPNNTVY